MVDIGVSKDALRAVIPLTGEFVGTTDTQTLTGKTIAVSSNSLTAASGAAGDTLKHDGTSYVRLAKGTANQVYTTNSGATDTAWGTAAVQGGGTGAATFTAGVVVSPGGTTALSTKTNPVGAFLGDSDTQNVTGAKTFTDQRLKLRNPAGTFTTTVVNPAVTADQDYRFNGPYAYYVFKSGSTYYAKSGITKTIESSSSSAATLIQTVVTAVLASSRGGIIQFSADDFAMDTFIDIPTATTSSVKPLILLGTKSESRLFGTMFSATTSFPTNRYFFETTGATDGSLKFASIHMRDLGAYNVNFATRNAGFLKYESDSNLPRQVTIDGLYTQYIWRPIHLIGVVWWGVFDNMHFEDQNVAFVGDADITLEQGTHTNASINPWPKSNAFRNTFAVHSGTTAGGGSMKCSLNAVDAGYNLFDYYWVDSNCQFIDSVFSFTGKATSNTMRDAIILDTNQVPSPDNRFGALYLSGTNCNDNRFVNCRFTDYKYMVAIKNGAYRNEVEIAGYWGGNLDIDDTGAGVDNVIKVFPGVLAAATPFSKPTTTASLVKIIDNRKGAYTTGTATVATGTSSIAVTHGCFTTPTRVRISPTTDTQASRRWWVSAKGSTTFTISTDSTVSPGVSFDWEADVY